MNQVDPNKYNRQYFTRAYGESVYLENQGCFFGVIHNLIYQEIAGLADIGPEDTLVDYGCGNGDLAFYLASKFHCQVKALDYSKSAIDICNEKLKQVCRFNDQIEFINNNTDFLPVFKNIKAMFFCDVIEHMTDKEFATILRQAKTWNTKIKIVVHTDNNSYLMFVNPFFNLFNFLLRNKSLSQIKEEKRVNRDLHINLTTPQKLKNKMRK